MTKQSYNDALRGYAHPVHQRDDFVCVYCGLDGKATFSNWLHLSEDHLLPQDNPKRDDLEYRVTSCRFCNEAHNRMVFDVEGKSPEELIDQKKPFVLQRRNEYKEFWKEQVVPK